MPNVGVIRHGTSAVSKYIILPWILINYICAISVQ